MTFLEYVEASGATVLPIGYTLTSETRVEMDWAPTESMVAGGRNQGLWSARTKVSNEGSHTMFMIGALEYRFDYYGMATTLTPPSTKSRVTIRTGTTTVEVGDTSATFSARTGASVKPFVLFASYASETAFGNYAYGRCYHFRAWEGDELVLDLWPCERDGVVGMYDLVSNAFHAPSAGTLTAPANRPVRIANLLAQGDFEAGGWSGGTFDTSRSFEGSKSYRLDGTASTAEVLAKYAHEIPIDPTHIYYLRWMVYHEGAPGTTGCYWGIAEPSVNDRTPVGSAGSWNVISWRGTRPTFSGMQGFRLDYNNGNAAGSLWVDAAMLVDLTDAFGAGGEPSQDSMDSVDYFTGAALYEDVNTEIVVPNISLISMQPNPVASGAAVLFQLRMGQVTSRYVVLRASDWTGTGPYHQDKAVTGIDSDDEMLVYADHTASAEQRVAEYNALLRASVVSDGVVRVTALSIRPETDIPVRITWGRMPVALATVPASAWTGTGPWTATVDMRKSYRTAICGPVDGMPDEQAEAFGDAGIHISALDGTTVTFRAVYAKPGIDLLIGVAGVRGWSCRS